MPILYKSTNNPDDRVNFETALLRGLAPDYGLYTIPREQIPMLSGSEIAGMKGKPYAEIALHVLAPYLLAEIPADALRALLEDAYREDKIPTEIQQVTGRTHIVWLTKGPTYSFKDYAARFFARALNYFLGKRGLKRTVVVATSGDTGGAVADALHGLENVDNIVFFPKGSISEGQRRQMTTLGANIYAFEVDGDFDVCQALAKDLLGNKTFAKEVFGESERFTSANSISVGRLLPQAVYPFYAYSRIADYPEPMLASIPSGNFGDMMGTVLAKGMGLSVSRILAGVNENTEFPEFLETGVYRIRPSIKSPSSAMIVSHPSNIARLIDFYGGHMHDERDPATGNVVKPGVITRMPNMDAMRRDIFSVGVDNSQHYRTMKEVYTTFGVVLDPHGAVGWRTLELYSSGRHDQLSVIYETADPGKFPEDVQQAIGLVPELPPGMKKQATMKERIYSINAAPESTAEGLKLSNAQVEEAKTVIREIFKQKS
ncbi:MAG: threonine synthase [Syntrophorhabdales bacterium]|jgi:threonine synthase